jgi:hypothetical protein
MDISETIGQSHKTLENNHISKGTVLLLLFFALLFTNFFMSLYYVCFISGLFFTLNVNSLICLKYSKAFIC